MRKFLVLLFLLFSSSSTFAGFPQGLHEKMFKDALQFKDILRTLGATTIDPTAVATPGEPGDLLFGTGDIYIKLDSGSSTNWDTMVQDIAFQAHIVDTTTHGTTGDIVGTTDTQTLSNKTLTSPVINVGVSGTAILDEDNMASDSDTQLATQQSIKAYVDTELLNATFPDDPFAIYDDVDNTKIAQFQSSGITTGTTQTFTFPDESGVLVLDSATQTLTNKALTSPVLNTSVSGTAVLDEDNMASDSDTQLATQQSIKAYVDTELAGATFSDGTFRVFDDVDNTKLVAFQIAAITTGTTRTMTVPDTDDTLVVLDLAQTLTNKTLTSPVLNTSVSGTAVLDEDNMVSDSDTQIATQQSIKAYVDTEISLNTVFEDDVFFMRDNGDITKRFQFQLAGISPATTQIYTAPNESGTLVLDSATQTLTNKTLTSAVLNTDVSGTAVLDEDDLVSDSDTQIATQQSIKAYVDTVDTNIRDDVNGIPINHLTGDDSDFETTVGNWVAYADAAAEVVVDGTGGAPTTTALRFTPSVIRGTGMLQILKDGADRQGEGASVDFSTAGADLTNIQKIEFEYSTSANYVDGDMRVYIVETGGPEVVRVLSGEDLIAGTRKTHVAYFQTLSTSSNYRLVLHVATTNASVYNVDVDRVIVGKPIGEGAGPFISDWEDFTPSVAYQGGSATNVTHSGKYRRVGSQMEVVFRTDFSAPSAAFQNPIYSIPSGFSIDSTDFNGTPIEQKVGDVWSVDTAVNTYTGDARWWTTTQVLTSTHRDAGLATGTFWSLTEAQPFTFNNGDFIQTRISVPIVGWETGVKPNEVRSGRAAYSSATMSALQNIGVTSVVKIPFDTVDSDTTASFDVGNNQFVAPESGYYGYSAGFYYSSVAVGNVLAIYAYKDGLQANVRFLRQAAALEDGTINISGTEFLEKGQALSIHVSSSDVGGYFVQNDANTRFEVINFNYLSGVIQPTESIEMHYTTDSALVVGTSQTTLTYEDKVRDSHNAYSGGTFTVPASRWCSINQQFVTDPEAYTNGNSVSASITRNGTELDLSFIRVMNTGTYQLQPSLNWAGPLDKGDTIVFRGASSVATNVSAAANLRNHISIKCD